MYMFMYTQSYGFLLFSSLFVQFAFTRARIDSLLSRQVLVYCTVQADN
jgi:hypothetical protein